MKWYYYSIIFILKITTFFIFNDALSLNYDEFDAYTIAQNIESGKGQTSLESFCNCYLPTARRGSFNIFLYQVIIKLGLSIEQWIFMYYCLMTILFIWSVFAFYEISKYYIQNKRWQIVSVLAYIFYPSVLIYIGSTFYYENLAVYSLILFYYYFGIRTQKMNYYFALILVLLALLSTLLRPHSLLIFVLLALVFLIKNYRSILHVFTLSLFILLILISNYLLKLRNEFYTGKPILSSQIGFELYQGHNPYARGSWMNYSYKTDLNVPANKFILEKYPTIPLSDEFLQSEIRKQEAIQWTLNHPKEEIILIFRKVAIYFLPQNFESFAFSSLYNPINLLIHIGCLLFFFFSIKQFKYELLPLFLPIAISLSFSILFFVGYRWRYYAEPFMIISCFAYFDLINSLKIKKSTIS